MHATDKVDFHDRMALPNPNPNPNPNRRLCFALHATAKVDLHRLVALADQPYPYPYA